MSDIYWMNWYHDSMDEKPKRRFNNGREREDVVQELPEPLQSDTPDNQGLPDDKENAETSGGDVQTELPDVQIQRTVPDGSSDGE